MKPIDIRIDDEELIESIAERLDAVGCKFDVDYTTLYGHNYSFIGIRVIRDAAGLLRLIGETIGAEEYEAAGFSQADAREMAAHDSVAAGNYQRAFEAVEDDS